MTTISDSITLNINNSLDVYDSSINSMESVITDHSNDYSGYVQNSISDVITNFDDIRQEIQTLTFYDDAPLTATDISGIETSYSQFYDKLQESNVKNAELNKIFNQYQTTKAKLENSKKTNTYWILMVWILMFLFVVTALFFSIIEDKKEINIFSKILLLIASLVVFVYIAKNTWFYIEKNIQ